MARLLLINPNTAQATTDMMVAIAQAACPDGIEIIGATAASGERMIVDPAALAASAAGVVAMGLQHQAAVAGIVVSAFGDPGLAGLRARVSIPVVGIAEAALLEAGTDGRRFGIATVTPQLVPAIEATVAALGLAACYTGTRLTEGDPVQLAAQPGALVAALAMASERCIREDDAQVVVIGGGPLGDAATALATRFDVPVVAPIPAAIRRVIGMLARG